MDEIKPIAGWLAFIGRKTACNNVKKMLKNIPQLAPNVYRLEEEYHRGVKVSTRKMELYETRFVRTPTVDRWSLKIEPIKDIC